MQDFDEIYEEEHQIRYKGSADGINQAQSSSYDDEYEQGRIFGLQLGKQLVIYQTFLNEYHKCNKQFGIKIKNTILKFEERISQCKLNSIAAINKDQEQMKKLFQIIVNMLGIRNHYKDQFGWGKDNCQF